MLPFFVLPFILDIRRLSQLQFLIGSISISLKKHQNKE